MILVIGFHPITAAPGITWTAVTAVVMFGLAFGKAKTGTALNNPALQAEGRDHHDRRDPCHCGARRAGAERNGEVVVGRSRRRVGIAVLRHSGGTGILSKSMNRSCSNRAAGDRDWPS